MLQNFLGKWVAVNLMGDMIVAFSEVEVRKNAELAFPYGVVESYINCVGCQIICSAVMDDQDLGKGSNQVPVPEKMSSLVFENYFSIKAEHSDDHDLEKGSNKMPVPEKLLSWVFENQFLIKAEHSFWGEEFTFRTFAMKHTSGASKSMSSKAESGFLDIPSSLASGTSSMQMQRKRFRWTFHLIFEGD
jgi:hypothetical protein